jgi:hypothetical protein
VLLYGFISDLLAYWFGTKWADAMARDNRNDPVYRKNVQELIARNRQFEKQHEPGTELHDDRI